MVDAYGSVLKATLLAHIAQRSTLQGQPVWTPKVDWNYERLRKEFMGEMIQRDTNGRHALGTAASQSQMQQSINVAHGADSGAVDALPCTYCRAPGHAARKCWRLGRAYVSGKMAAGFSVPVDYVPALPTNDFVDPYAVYFGNEKSGPRCGRPSSGNQ